MAIDTVQKVADTEFGPKSVNRDEKIDVNVHPLPKDCKTTIEESISKESNSKRATSKNSNKVVTQLHNKPYAGP